MTEPAHDGDKGTRVLTVEIGYKGLSGHGLRMQMIERIRTMGVICGGVSGASVTNVDEMEPFIGNRLRVTIDYSGPYGEAACKRLVREIETLYLSEEKKLLFVSDAWVDSVGGIPEVS